MNAVLARASPRRNASTEGEHVAKKAAAMERRRLASIHVDCKRSHIARLAHEKANPKAKHGIRVQAGRAVAVGWQRGRTR